MEATHDLKVSNPNPQNTISTFHMLRK